MQTFHTDRFLPLFPDGGRLAYGLAGESGPPVLLLMGFAMPGRAWSNQIPALSRAHRVAFYDHRGAGSTVAPPGAYTMALLAGDALSLMDHLGWGSAHLVGVSMGGMVAQHLALAHPGRIRSLTLMVTHPGGLRFFPPLPSGLVGFLRVNLVRDPEARLAALERLLFPASYLTTCDRAWVRETLRRDIDTESTRARRLSQFAAVLRHDTRTRLGALGALPTLVVKASRDILIQPAASDALHRRIPESRLLVLKEAGHGVIRQCHAEVNAALLEHFAHAESRAQISEGA